MKKKSAFIIMFVALVLIALAFILYKYFATNGFQELKEIFTKSLVLEKIYYFIRINGKNILIMVVILLADRYVLTSHFERTKSNMEMAKNMTEIRNYNEAEIIPRYDGIEYVARERIINPFEKIKSNDMRKFFQGVLRDLISEANIIKLDTVMKEKEDIEAIMAAELVFVLYLNVQKILYVEEKNEKKDINMLSDTEVKTFVLNFISESLNKTDYDNQKKEKIIDFELARRFKEKGQVLNEDSIVLDDLIKKTQELLKIAIVNDRVLQEEKKNERIMELEEENARMRNKLKYSFPVHIICYSTLCSAIMAVSGFLLILRFAFKIYIIEPYYLICALLISATLFFTAIVAIKDWKDYLNGEG